MQIVSQLENQHKKEEARLKAMTEYLQLAATGKGEEDGMAGEEERDSGEENSKSAMNGHASPPAPSHNNNGHARADIGRNGGGSDRPSAGGGMNIFNTAAAFAALNNHQPQQQHSPAAASGNPFMGRSVTLDLNDYILLQI